ncbi:hypothetical protein SCHPADRAFT_910562 [Schizopora paradoxa]|uniref:Secreted protein n=1 Tax=Schizopora paradoxa TaxID=27342 RepID=A0A0H2R2W3_9AGAM|nr:hypothetical protein SCHPADRAFT_910562 [Schizopora paradoxa]
MMCRWGLPLLVTVVRLSSSGRLILRSVVLLEARAPRLFLAGVDNFLLSFHSSILSRDHPSL